MARKAPSPPTAVTVEAENDVQAPMHAEREHPLVSVVIPCYKQAHFLSDALTSVAHQTYRNVETIVVDDGSPDNAWEIAARYPEVRCIRQRNQGQPAARNRGLMASRGDLIVFLDADDRLLPRALEIGVTALRRRPECAFVFGGCSLIAADGSPLPYICAVREEPDHYSALLRGNAIVTPGTVMFRTDVVKRFGGFDTLLRASEDYELYLRLTRQLPVSCHGVVVLEKRKHETNLTNSSLATWPSALEVRLREWTYAQQTATYRDAYRVGFDRFMDDNISGLFHTVVRGIRQRRRGDVLTALRLLVSPPSVAWYAARKLVRAAAGRRTVMVGAGRNIG